MDPMRDEPPSRSFSGGGKIGWYAVRPDGSPFDDDDEPWTPPHPDSVIRLMETTLSRFHYGMTTA